MPQISAQYKTLVALSKGVPTKIIATSFIVFAGLNYYKGSEKFYENILMPTVTLISPKHAEDFAKFVHKHRLSPKSRYRDPETLKFQMNSLLFSNPIGIGSGFDKKGQLLKSLSNVGFGFVEIGSIRPVPRVFDFPIDRSKILQSHTYDCFINDRIIKRINQFRQQNKRTNVGINLENAPNSTNNILDYIEGVKKFAPVVNFIVINLENRPVDIFKDRNTKKISKFISQVLKASKENVERPPAVLLKLPSDITSIECRFLGNILKSKQCRVHGVIVKDNTELAKENEIIPKWPIRNIDRDTSSIVSEMYQVTLGKIPIIVDGGVKTGQDAYEKIKQGASLIQVYEPFIQYGPPRIKRIKKDLHKLLTEDGFENVSNAVGFNFKQKNKHYYFPFY